MSELGKAATIVAADDDACWRERYAWLYDDEDIWASDDDDRGSALIQSPVVVRGSARRGPRA